MNRNIFPRTRTETCTSQTSQALCRRYRKSSRLDAPNQKWSQPCFLCLIGGDLSSPSRSFPGKSDAECSGWTWLAYPDGSKQRRSLTDSAYWNKTTLSTDITASARTYMTEAAENVLAKESSLTDGSKIVPSVTVISCRLYGTKLMRPCEYVICYNRKHSRSGIEVPKNLAFQPFLPCSLVARTVWICYTHHKSNAWQLAHILGIDM